MTDEFPKKTGRKIKIATVLSEEGVVAPIDKHIVSYKIVFRATVRKWYVRTLRFFIGTHRRQYTTLGVFVLLVLCLFIWHRTATAQPSSAQLLSELSQVMVVPREQPQIATVTNAAVLKSQQPFYADVENGDVMFLFPQAGKAVLFRPSTHQVVNAGPVNVQTPTKK